MSGSLCNESLYNGSLCNGSLCNGSLSHAIEAVALSADVSTYRRLAQRLLIYCHCRLRRDLHH